MSYLQLTIPGDKTPDLMSYLQLNTFRVVVSHGNLDPSALLVADFQSQESMDLQVLQSTLTTGSQGDLFLEPQMNTGRAKTFDLQFSMSSLFFKC